MKPFFVVFILSFIFPLLSMAQEKIRFNFVNEEIEKIVDLYTKATGTRMIIDSDVRGKISLVNPSDLTFDQALNQLGDALAINGYSMNKKDEYWIVRNARSAQRDTAEVNSSLPMLHPQRMATWIVTLRYSSAADARQSIGRIFNSAYGEMVEIKNTNQLIISDFTSTLHRIHKMLLEIDKPTDTKFAKVNEQVQRAERAKRVAEEKKTVTTIETETTSNDANADMSKPLDSAKGVNKASDEKVNDLEIKIRKDDPTKEKVRP